MADSALTAAPRSLTERVLKALTAPRASYAVESEGLSERRLVAYAFGAALFLTLGRVLAETARPELAAGEDRTAWFAATIFIGFSFGVLSLYAVAALVRIVSRLFGGKGGWAATRLALFWSAFTAGPLIAVAHLFGAVIDGRSVAGLLGGVVWAIWFTPMLAAAHGFRPFRVAITLSLLALCALALPNFV